MKCAAFWKHTNIRGGNRVFPCCRFKTPVQEFDGNLDNILHSTEYEKLRNTDVSTLWHCSKCMREEENGKESLRQRFNKEYDTDTVELKFLEIGFDNICNLACDGCYSEFSSTWAKITSPDAPKEEIYLTTNEITQVPNTIDKVLFLGGEPLMTNRHHVFLESLENKGTITVTYNTNGTFLLKPQTVELLKLFKHVEFIVSVDGYGELNDRVRKYSKWADILEFIDQIKQNSFDFLIHTTIHKNNIHGLPELALWIKMHNYRWTTNVLTYPTHLDISKLSSDEKQLAAEQIKSIEGMDYVCLILEN